MMKDGHVVGHVPHVTYIYTLCHFIRKGGSILCKIIGRHKYSRDLPQGGMDVPCCLHFMGKKGDVKKIECLIKKFKDSSKITISETESHVTKQTKQDDEICTPSKKFKHSSESETCRSSEVWVAYPRHVLPIKDKVLLEAGEHLNDKHIAYKFSPVLSKPLIS